MGARAVLIGRAYAYGLGAGGHAGVTRAIDILRSDVVRTMKLLGCAAIKDLDGSFVDVPSEWTARLPGKQPMRARKSAIDLKSEIRNPRSFSCHYDLLSASSNPRRPWKAPASSCTAASASAKPASSIRSCSSTTSATSGPDDYLAGFPWHPHRGIETITYVLAGTVDHGDSLGNRGSLGAGDVQWMTAGSGIMHQEMPKGDPQGRMHGFQLWANLPKSLKMTDPRYQDILAKDIPEVTDDDGTRARIVVGDFWGKRGPVEGVAADPRYLDISVPPNRTKRIPVEASRHAFAYVFAGSGTFRDSSKPLPVQTELVGVSDDATPSMLGNRSLVLFDSGDEITVTAGDEGIRFLLVSGRPLEEPVAWYGPIVMNTRAEIQQAYAELRAARSSST